MTGELGTNLRRNETQSWLLLMPQHIHLRKHQKGGAWSVPCAFHMTNELHKMLWPRGCPWAQRLYLIYVLAYKSICYLTSPGVLSKSENSKRERDDQSFFFLLSWTPRSPCQMKLVKVDIKEHLFQTDTQPETQQGGGKCADKVS